LVVLVLAENQIATDRCLQMLASEASDPVFDRLTGFPGQTATLPAPDPT